MTSTTAPRKPAAKALPTREALIARLHAVFHSRGFTERDAFSLVGAMIQVDPIIAGALAHHIRDIIQDIMDGATMTANATALDQGAEEGDALELEVALDYSYILAHAYERTFFSKEHAKTYGTTVFAGDLPRLVMLVETLQTMYDIQDAGGDNIISFGVEAMSRREH